MILKIANRAKRPNLGVLNKGKHLIQLLKEVILNVLDLKQTHLLGHHIAVVDLIALKSLHEALD